MSLASIQMIRQSIEKIVAYAKYDLESPELHNTSVVLCLTIAEMSDYIPTGGDRGPVFEIDSIVICVLTIGLCCYKFTFYRPHVTYEIV